jgi:hypothetical protein
MIARNFIAYLLQTPEQKNEWPLMSPGCCGWFKQAKHWAIEHGRAHARRHVPADRCPAAGRSRGEWFGMQLTVSSFDFCLPASRGRLEVLPAPIRRLSLHKQRVTTPQAGRQALPLSDNMRGTPAD